MARVFAGGVQTDNINFGTMAGSTQRSAMIWFKTAGALDATARRYWDWGDAGGGLDLCSQDSTNSISYTVNWTGNGVWVVTAANFTPTSGTWYNLIITYDGSSTANNAVIYINGVSQTVGSTSPTGTIASTSRTQEVGNRNTDSARCFNGSLAHYARWNRILDASEISSLASGYSPLFFTNGLTFYSKINGVDNPERDLIGGLSGVLTNTTKGVDPEQMRYPKSLTINKLRPAIFAPGIAR